MMIPVRCFTCGKPVADKYDAYKSAVENGTPAATALDDVGMERYCCRRMFLAQAELMDEIRKYPRF
jgi:DNA-directed RNA polymerase subunit N